MHIKFRKIFGLGPQLYKLLLVLFTVLLLVEFYPGKYNFNYEYELNKPWGYPDLYAPFDVMVGYSPDEVDQIMDSIERTAPWVIVKEPVDSRSIKEHIVEELKQSADSVSPATIALVEKIVDSIYRTGLLNTRMAADRHGLMLLQGKELKEIKHRPFSLDEFHAYINRNLKDTGANQTHIKELLFQYIKPDLSIDRHYTEKLVDELKNNFNPNKKIIYKGERIISKGEKINNETFEVLESLKRAFAEDVQFARVKTFGFFLVSLFLLILLLLFFKEFEEKLFNNNSALTLIFTNIIIFTLAFFLTSAYLPRYLYLIPLILVSFILKNFFSWRVAFATTFTIALISSFGVPDPFEFLMLQLPASWMAIIGTSDLTKRSKMFIYTGKVVLVYIFMYIAYELAIKGSWEYLNLGYFIFFILNGFLAVAFVNELILIYEKLFGQVSDVSLLELLNTDNKLLKKLAEKAPGTFHHSLQVANLAEALANELKANALLVRVGALYHDVGKMKNPRYFTENQTRGFNPHDDLKPQESARIIINHVIDGIETARRNRLPERVIDFIRTHHGTDVVQYFYEKALQQDGEVDESQFRYPGPNPFSKETAIVMMADSVEAASKSLKNPTREQIDNLVDKVIDRKLHLGLFDSAEITLKEISLAKKVLKNKLRSIYHPRIEYPETGFEKKEEKS